MVPEGALPILARVDEHSGRRLARSTAIFSLATALSRILGLVREVVAQGRDPRGTTLREIAEPPNATVDSDMPLTDAFAFLEQNDFERVPVVDADGKLVGVLSRSSIQRRLQEDEPPEDLPPRED